MAQLLRHAITGATDSRGITARLFGPVGAPVNYFSTRDELANSQWHSAALKVLPAPSDNTADDFGVQSGGGFTAEIAALTDAVASVVAAADSANLFVDPTNPLSQTTPSLPIGTYTLWFVGFGEIVAAAGTASITLITSGTATETGAATQSSYVTFDVTAAGTVVLTVSLWEQNYCLDNYFAEPYVDAALTVV